MWKMTTVGRLWAVICFSKRRIQPGCHVLAHPRQVSVDIRTAGVGWIVMSQGELTSSVSCVPDGKQLMCFMSCHIFFAGGRPTAPARQTFLYSFPVELAGFIPFLIWTLTLSEFTVFFGAKPKRNFSFERKFSVISFSPHSLIEFKSHFHLSSPWRGWFKLLTAP